MLKEERHRRILDVLGAEGRVVLRRVLVERADRVVGLASREKLATTAPFWFAPATALTHLATEPGVPAELLEPFEELGIEVVR